MHADMHAFKLIEINTTNGGTWIWLGFVFPPHSHSDLCDKHSIVAYAPF